MLLRNCAHIRPKRPAVPRRTDVFHPSLRLLLIPALLAFACSDEEAALKVGAPDLPIAPPAAGGQPAQGGGLEPGPPGNLNPQGASVSHGYAVPQEELARMPESAMKITGTIQVTGADSGLLQIDVVPANTEGGIGTGTAPITVARFKSPGPYELYIPLKAEKVFLNLNLDLKGDGPDASDPRTAYEKNPITVNKQGAADINFVLDATQPQGQPSGAPQGAVGTAPTTPGSPPLSSAPPGSAPAGLPGTPTAPAGGVSPASSGQAPTVQAPTVQAPTVQAPTVQAPTVKAPTLPASPTAPALTAPSAAVAPAAPKAATVQAPSLPVAPAPASVPIGEKPEVRPSTSGMKPGATDGRPIMDVLDESLDGAPQRAK